MSSARASNSLYHPMEIDMKKTLIHLAVISSLFTMSNVQADDLALGPIAIIHETGAQTAVHAEAGFFRDTFTFTGASFTAGSAIGLSFSLPDTPGIEFVNVGLNDIFGTVALVNGVTSFFVSNVAADNFGSYQLIVFGTASAPLANYGVTLNVSAVPEPSTYAMVLAGLGLIGFMSKRRQTY